MGLKMRQLSERLRRWDLGEVAGTEPNALSCPRRSAGLLGETSTPPVSHPRGDMGWGAIHVQVGLLVGCNQVPLKGELVVANVFRTLRERTK
jgi:hypothetical protein